MKKQFVVIQRDNIGNTWIYGVVFASDKEEVESKSQNIYGEVAEVPEDKFLVLLDRKLVEKLEEAIQESGFDAPITMDEWNETINSYVERILVEDFGEEYITD